MLKSILIASLLITVACAPVLAQGDDAGASSGRFNTWAVGINVGHTMPFTDIRQYDYYPVFKYQNENRFGIGLHLNKSLSNVFSIQGRFLYGSLQGTKRGRLITRGGETGFLNGVYSNTSILNYGLNLIVNVSNVAFAPKDAGKERKTSLYFLIGHGLVHFDAKGYMLRSDRELTTYKQGVSGKTTEAANPMGMGFKYKLNSKIDAGLELNIIRVNSDKLDGFVQGSSPDYFSYTNLNVTYKFGSAGTDADHLDWVNPMEVMYNDIQENKQAIAELTGDKDNDGVADRFDKDSATPEGTKVDGSGVALDVDQDGVPDSEDEDPFTDIGAKVDDKGKAIDSDGDGVPDSRDLEANTAKGALVNFQGKTIGKMPTGGGGGGGGGGGTINTGGGSTAYFPSVYFDTNSSKIKYANYDRLATIARAMKANDGITITLTGHADKTGGEAYNMKLGERRAQAVADHLAKHYGIDKGRFKVVSKGETDALAKDLNHINRRVDVGM